MAIKWHLGILRYPQDRWAWCQDPMKKQSVIKEIMPFSHFQLLNKHFCVVSPSDLPSKHSVNYHPLQNILKATDYLQQKSRELWEPGQKLCGDETRVRSKSKFNKFKIRNKDKPIKMGYTIPKIADRWATRRLLHPESHCQSWQIYITRGA